MRKPKKLSREELAPFVVELPAANPFTRPAAARIVRETAEQVQAWEGVALELGLPDGERRRMARAFDADRIARALTIE